MKQFMKIWKKSALCFPRIYLFSCWILLGAAGMAMGIGGEWTVLGILVIGYFLNIIWMMRI